MYTYRCAVSDYDVSTGVCSNPQWVYTDGLLPAISVSDAFLLSGLVIGIWALGASFKMIRKFIK